MEAGRRDLPPGEMEARPRRSRRKGSAISRRGRGSSAERGIVSLGLGTYFALAANSQLSDLDASCSPHCTQAQTQTGRTDALLFDVFVGVGAAAVAGALVWAFAFPSYSPAPASRSAALSRSRLARFPRFELRPLNGGAFTSITVAY
jgi:hypothetical protein